MLVDDGNGLLDSETAAIDAPPDGGSSVPQALLGDRDTLPPMDIQAAVRILTPAGPMRSSASPWSMSLGTPPPTMAASWQHRTHREAVRCCQRLPSLSACRPPRYAPAPVEREARAGRPCGERMRPAGESGHGARDLPHLSVRREGGGQ